MIIVAGRVAIPFGVIWREIQACRPFGKLSARKMAPEALFMSVEASHVYMESLERSGVIVRYLALS